MRAPKPVTMWAAVISGSHSEWINHFTIRSRRIDAKGAYIHFIGLEHAKKMIKAKRVRFVRVTVAVQEGK